MNAHPFLDDELAERAALYVLGTLEPEDARAFRLHAAGCAVCRAELDALQRAAGALALSAPLATPPPALFERVRQRIRGTPRAEAERIQVWKRWAAGASSPAAALPDAPEGMTIVPASGAGGEFEPTAIAGIQVRQLFVDAPNDRATMLVRMAPGTSYPAHRHGGEEECFVLQGDLSFSGQRMRAGDYQRAETGSVHDVQTTEQGCLLLIVSSLRDEMLG